MGDDDNDAEDEDVERDLVLQNFFPSSLTERANKVKYLSLASLSRLANLSVKPGTCLIGVCPNEAPLGKAQALLTNVRTKLWAY